MDLSPEGDWEGELEDKRKQQFFKRYFEIISFGENALCF